MGVLRLRLTRLKTQAGDFSDHKGILYSSSSEQFSLVSVWAGSRLDDGDIFVFRPRRR